MEEGRATEAIWRCFLAALDWDDIDRASPAWTRVAAFSDAHPARYAFRTTARAVRALEDTLEAYKDAQGIDGWSRNAARVTRKLLKAADDLLRRVHDLRDFERMVNGHLGRTRPPLEACELRVQRLADMLRAAPGALFIDPAVWARSDFWECFWLCAIGQIALTPDEADVPEGVTRYAIDALVPLARRLLTDPEQHQLCASWLGNLMSRNEDNVYTQMPSFQYALDRLNLRRLAETQLLRKELLYRQDGPHDEWDPLTLLSGNPYAPPAPR